MDMGNHWTARPFDTSNEEQKIGRWRSVVGGLVGSVTVGMVLLGLVLAAAVVTAKKRGRRAKREDMERKTYEEEALRVVTMVGHSRVLVAICYKDFVWLRFLFI
ncbi:hypothetical protein F2Q69_00040732 [Brassica cretica]|uniref:Uncharacterized protein n=1 Tax=Brassica cretica TaxID=69181 RepID=A0A8S9NLV5_BRACR|nr:hypothetical protein F2Q69_00040732 [Brassica cretica]